MKRHRSNHLLRVLAVGGLGLMITVGTPAVRADLSITFDPSQSTVSGFSVDATAVFDINSSAGTITITLTNNESNPTNDVQTLNGVAFQLNGSAQGLNFQYTSQTGTQITFDKNGGFSTSSSFTRWAVNNQAYNKTGTEVTSFGSGGNATPNLIGEPDSTTNPPSYSSADSSIKTKGNKFLQGTTTIVLTLSNNNSKNRGLLATATSLSMMQFEFGTSAGSNEVLGLDPPPTPEPSTLALASLGALGFIAYGLRRRLKK
jgi:PEP-CTERM motif